MDGHSSYLPDSCYWRPLDKDFKPGEDVQAWLPNPKAFYHLDKQVLMNTEDAWKVEGLQPPGFTMLMGEDDVLSPAFDGGDTAVWYWKQKVDGQRDLGYSIDLQLHRRDRPQPPLHMHQCFIMPDHVHNFFSGQKLQRPYSLHNDIFTPADFDLRWRLTDAGGKVLCQRARCPTHGQRRHAARATRNRSAHGGAAHAAQHCM